MNIKEYTAENVPRQSLGKYAETSEDLLEGLRRKRVKRKILTYGGLIFADLAVAVLLYVNTPEVYRTGYQGGWVPYVAGHGDNVTKVITKRGAEGSMAFWRGEINRKNKERNEKFNIDSIDVRDTVYLPADMTLDQRKSKSGGDGE